MRQIIFTLLITTLILGATGAQELTVVTEQRPPYNYEENGNVVGLSTDVVKATLETAGITGDFRLYPWARAYNTAQNQANVLIYTIVRSPEREDLFHWVGPVIPSVRICLYRLKKREDIVINTLDDAKKYTIGVTREDSMHQYLLEQGFEEGQHLDVVTRDEQNLKKLFADRIDLLVDGELSIPLRMKELDLPFAEVEQAFLLAEWEDILYMAISKQTPEETVERVKTAFEQLKADVTLEAIINSYITPSE